MRTEVRGDPPPGHVTPRTSGKLKRKYIMTTARYDSFGAAADAKGNA